MTSADDAAPSTGEKASATASQAADRAGDVADRAGDAAQDAAQDAASSKPFRIAARSGFAVNGLLHVLIGVLTIRIATGNGGRGQADQSGAFRQIAKAPGGDALLWILVVGLAALGVWQIVHIVQSRGSQRKNIWWHRAGDATRAVLYFAIGATAFTFARGGSTNSTSASKTASARLLEVPGGEWVLIAGGLTVLGVGVYFVVRGLILKFRNDLDMPSGALGVIVTVVGLVGYVAKGVALGVVGILFVVAAWTFDPQKASGLDGAILTLSRLRFGHVILLAVGIGVIVYGLFLGARARWGKLD